MRRQREQVGPFVITKAADLDARGIVCEYCENLLTTFDAERDTHVPSCEELLTAGSVAVPNFGWFCSQDCANTYSRETGITFQRDAEGRVSYYP